RDKIFYRVIRKEFLVFAEKLRRERLIRGKYQRRFLYTFDNFGNCIGFPAPRYSQQSLHLSAISDAFSQLLNRFWLITGGLERCFYIKFWHSFFILKEYIIFYKLPIIITIIR